MAMLPAPSPDNISKHEFLEALNSYPSILQTVSDQKGAKDGQHSLEQLDRYRYSDAIEAFSRENSMDQMDLEDVKKLVQWKLRHGKFRPNLMKLVSSNDSSTAQKTIIRAVKIYREEADVAAALGVLSQLRGIGPATASLLLAVHEPGKVIFFGDEVYHWLYCNGKIQAAKYNVKEYIGLYESATTLAARLNVSMLQIEKVAYVLMKQDQYPRPSNENSSGGSVELVSQPKKTNTYKSTAKRKSISHAREDELNTPRRSKRSRMGKK